VISALPAKADIAKCWQDVRFVPLSDIANPWSCSLNCVGITQGSRANKRVCVPAKPNAESKPTFLAKTRRDLFAHEAQRAHDFFIAEQTPAIDFRQNAIEAKLAG
jgi:hypothetical protein